MFGRIKNAGGARSVYTLLLAALLPFLFAGSLFVGLADAMGARAAQPDLQTKAADRDAVPEDGAVEASADPEGEDPRLPAWNYYVLPLSDAMQDEVYLLCDKYDVPPDLVFGMISAEAVTASPYSGSCSDKPMGTPADSAAWCAEQLGITGEATFDQNLECGVLLLAEYCHKYSDPEAVAMCYELGENEALRRISRGESSTQFSRLVVREMTTLTERPPKQK